MKKLNKNGIMTLAFIPAAWAASVIFGLVISALPITIDKFGYENMKNKPKTIDTRTNPASIKPNLGGDA